jgi:hypothetical protein
LSQIVLAHALRQAHVWLIFDVRQKKTMLTNALLRIERHTAVLPSPFELVANGVWVLEIPVAGTDDSEQFSAVLSYVRNKRSLIIQNTTDADLTLHLAVRSSLLSRIPADLVSLTAEIGASIEIYQADE